MMTTSTHCHECAQTTLHQVVKTETYHDTGEVYRDLRCLVCKRFSVHVRLNEALRRM